MKHRVRLIQTYEYTLDPSLYPEGLSVEEMVELDLENNTTEYIEDWTTTYQILGEVTP